MKVELSKFIQAFESWANRDFDEYYFDKNTGEILSADATASKDPAKFATVERSPELFIQIKPLPAQDIALLMDDFVGTLTDEEIREDLEELLLESGTYEEFKLTLSELPEVQKNWEEFHRREMKQVATSWLRNHDLSFSFD